MNCFDLKLWAGYIPAGGSSSEPANIDQICVDSRCIQSQNALFVALQGNEDGHRFVEHAKLSGAKFALVSHASYSQKSLEGIQLLKVDSPLDSLQAIAKAYRLNQPAKVIGIAGTYGKTMVKDLLQLMLSNKFSVAASPGSFNSQIGVPLSLLTIRQEHEVALIEAAISEKNEMDALGEMIQPDAVIFAPIGKKHIATLNDVETVNTETLKLLHYIKAGGWALLPKMYESEGKVGERFKRYCWDAKFTGLPHAYLLHENNTNLDSFPAYVIDFPDGQSFRGEITAGFYYFLNLINLTVKAAWLLGVGFDDIVKVLTNYHPEPMRTEIWKTQQGVTFINDSYCSDPNSVDRALRHFEQTSCSRKIFLFGGMRGKGSNECSYDYKRIGAALKHRGIDQLFLIGNHSFKPLIDEFKKDSLDDKIIFFKEEKEAFLHLRTILQPHDSVLLKGDRKKSLAYLMEAFSDSSGSNHFFINLDAVSSNLKRLRSRLPPKTRVMAMVKAFAYGTGEWELAKFLSSCAVDILGVSYVDEAVALRSSAVSQAIFVLNAAPYEAAIVAKWKFEVGISNKAMIVALENEGRLKGVKIKVHLHVDTGMGRFGCRPEEALELARMIVEASSLELEGIMTHFAAADTPAEDPFTLAQAEQFDAVIQELALHGISVKWHHASNSSAAVRFKFSQYNMVRIGLALYGLQASEEATKSLDLQLALSLTSRIVGINICKAGETVSYGRSYQVTGSMQRIAILPLGYFDGLHRKYSNKGSVMIRGERAPIVGKICMDFMMVDITNIPSAIVGDPVLIFGKDELGQSLPAEEFASQGDSIVHELITCLGPRIQRIFVHEEKDE
ncbi:MAG: alanine racemase [Parachlamydiaceae bacterium]|nr:alanine racemase [Parachlamydiaceae bacterium]